MVTVVEWEEFATNWLVKYSPIDHVREALSWLRTIQIEPRKWEKQKKKIKKQLQRFSISYIKHLENGKPSPLQESLLDAVLSGYLAGIADAKTRSKLERFAEPEFKAILDFKRPPRDAIAFWLSVRIISQEEYRKLEEAFRPYVFTMALTTDKNMMIRMKNYIERGLREGFNEEEFIRRIRKLSEDLWREFQAPYLKTVFRTNLNTAMNAARWNQYMQDPFVEILVYKTMADGRVRPTHRMMHNFAAPKTDDVWKQWFPPNGYNCRCFVIGMSKEDWKDEKKFIQEEAKYASKDEKWQWKPKETVPKIDGKPISPDPGFHNAPATFHLINPQRPIVHGLRLSKRFVKGMSIKKPPEYLKGWKWKPYKPVQRASTIEDAISQVQQFFVEEIKPEHIEGIPLEALNDIAKYFYEIFQQYKLPPMKALYSFKYAERLEIFSIDKIDDYNHTFGIFSDYSVALNEEFLKNYPNYPEIKRVLDHSIVIGTLENIQNDRALIYLEAGIIHEIAHFIKSLKESSKSFKKFMKKCKKISHRKLQMLFKTSEDEFFAEFFLMYYYERQSRREFEKYFLLLDREMH